MYDLPSCKLKEWFGLPIQVDIDTSHEVYLSRIHELLVECLIEHPRWTVIRIDLHSPSSVIVPGGAITRFIESIKAQLEHVKQIKSAAGKRVYDPKLRYVWVREWNQADQPHYHLALLLNHDAYFSLGNYARLNDPDSDYVDMLSGRIYKAWGVALGIGWRQAKSGVHYPERPVSALLRHGVNSFRQMFGVFYRLSYFAKLQTKRYGEEGRNFGMSQLRCIKRLPG